MNVRNNISYFNSTMKFGANPLGGGNGVMYSIIGFQNNLM